MRSVTVAKKEPTTSAHDGRQRSGLTNEPKKSIARRTLPNKELVERVRQAFPDKYKGFGIEEASKGKHTAYTGLEYCDDIKALTLPSDSHRIEFRSLPCKFTWRCTEALKVRLQIAKKAFGEDCTAQEFINTAVLNEIERIEKKRGGGVLSV